MGLFKKPRTENMEPMDDFNETPQLEMYQVKSPQMLEEEKWEQRRWELARYLVAQDRRSVVLGKLNSSPQAIARKARQLADATINELRNHKPESNGDE
jgi:hypothetical protein